MKYQFDDDAFYLFLQKQKLFSRASKLRAALTSLMMEEVQGSEDKAGVQLGTGSTVVLSACNTGRWEIKAEGVMGLARGFLLAGAAAAVVSLWSVDDGGVGQRSSSRDAKQLAISILPVENEAEQRAYWREFCKHNVEPTTFRP